MSVTVENLTKRYGKQTAVDNLSFTARQGEVLGFLGPNGAGKTTSLRMMAGLLKPDSGRVLYQDLDIWESPTEARKFIGYLPESNPLYLDMYVREALQFYARIHRVPDERIEGTIQRLGLTRESNKRIRQLSKGYRQRVGLGIAILHDPEILILDEPVSGLDPNQLADIRLLIRELAADKTIIFSSHILSEVEQLCDRLLIIHDGKLRAFDSLASLQAQQDGRQIIVAELGRTVNEDQLRKIDSMEYCEILDGHKVRLVARSGKDMRRDLYDWTKAQNTPLLESRVEQTSMASLFEKLTQ
ncbi:MAG TPA: ATP-binding cassette domain-containing protein [Membranihabitans sp.]|nr:ATP-binding cassette domain-containing protein [Membranihabitans sp.]